MESTSCPKDMFTPLCVNVPHCNHLGLVSACQWKKQAWTIQSSTWRDDWVCILSCNEREDRGTKAEAQALCIWFTVIYVFESPDVKVYLYSRSTRRQRAPIDTCEVRRTVTKHVGRLWWTTVLRSSRTHRTLQAEKVSNDNHVTGGPFHSPSFLTQPPS